MCVETENKLFRKICDCGSLKNIQEENLSSFLQKAFFDSDDWVWSRGC